MKKNILFFADRLPPLTGGMEMHAKYFIEHFKDDEEFFIENIITKNNNEDCIIKNNQLIKVDLEDLSKNCTPQILFFNSGRWIEEFKLLKKLFPNAKFIYRTGGNEILKAPLEKEFILNHVERQKYWVEVLNETIDYIITNSHFTENRLQDLGVNTNFKRFVGGVNFKAIKKAKIFKTQNNIPNIFCAARFVPYKNHSEMISILNNLKLRGYIFKAKFAGNGILLEEIRNLVKKYELDNMVEFLGILDNDRVCAETAQADFYMQLSSDKVTKVEGGEYIHSEGMGRSILEALSAGTFIIAGNSGALAEIITSERGIILKLDDIATMVNKIEEIIKNGPYMLPMIEDYSWDNIFKNYVSFFKNITI